MTGPQHYSMAEQLLANAANLEFPSKEYGQTLAEAQVHATLALAAAAGVSRPSIAEAAAWQEAAGTAREFTEGDSWYRFRREQDRQAPPPEDKVGDG